MESRKIRAGICAAALTASAVFSSAAVAQDVQSPVSVSSKGIMAFSAPYVRFSLGSEQSAIKDGYWLPPGAADPFVAFDLNSTDSITGTVAYGRTVGQGLRGEVALSVYGNKDIAGTWSYTVPATAGPHADITAASVKSTSLMANLFYSPLQAQGNYGRFQPFVMGGLGLALNKTGDWTRERAAAVQPVRTFAGATNADLAWTLGLGGAWEITGKTGKPMMLEVMYQYVDLGKAVGGVTPLPGSGTSSPRQALTIKNNSHVFSVGLRVPLN